MWKREIMMKELKIVSLNSLEELPEYTPEELEECREIGLEVARRISCKPGSKEEHSDTDDIDVLNAALSLLSLLTQ